MDQPTERPIDQPIPTTARWNFPGKRPCPAPDEAGAGARGRETKVSSDITANKDAPLPHSLTRRTDDLYNLFSFHVLDLSGQICS